MTITKAEIKKDITGLMTKYDLTLEDLASKLGVSSMTIYRWAKGQHSPKSRLYTRALADLKTELSKGKGKG